MQFNRSLTLKIAAAGLLLAGATMAQARSDVHWSLGIHAAPGVTIGVGNSPYYVPQPVYTAPPVVYSQPYYVQPAPVYYVRPAPVYAPVYGVGYYGQRHHRHDRHHGHRGHGGHGGHHGHR